MGHTLAGTSGLPAVYTSFLFLVTAFLAFDSGLQADDSHAEPESAV